MARLDRALDEYRSAIALADSITLDRARRDLEAYAAEYPDTPGLEQVYALFEGAGKE
jgi:hypothetical protein